VCADELCCLPPPASSAAENWDADFDFPESPSLDRVKPTPSSKAPIPAPFPRAVLSNAEAGPSTPSRVPAKRVADIAHENWDDDFLDRDSSAFPSPPRASGSSARRRARSAAQGTPPVRRTPRRTGSYAPPSPTRNGNAQHENWDAEFGLRAPKSSTGAASWTSSCSSSSDERELGILTPTKADDEDHTVTARHKRVPVPIKLDTPPPVPPLPAGLPPAPRSPLVPRAPSSLSTRSELQLTSGPPRSPEPSVFSGHSGRESSLGAHTIGTYSSTAALHLRKTLSGNSSRSHLAGHALAFPPTPPQHRERRRLRKKRDRDDVVELRDMEGKAVLRKRRPLPRAEDVFDPARRQSIEEEPEGFSDDLPESDLHGGLEQAYASNLDLSRPQTPERPPASVVNAPPPASTPAPTPPAVIPTSPSTRTPLLARIGSVTGWGLRKKRASTAPSEHSPVGSTGSGPEATPRPTSSLAGVALPPMPSSPPGSKSWFRSPNTELQRKDSASRLRAVAPGSPSRRKGASMPPLLSLISRQASSGTDEVPLDDLTLPAQPEFAQPPLPPRPEKTPSRISRRLSALPLPGRAQKARHSSYGGSSGARSQSSLSVNHIGQPPSVEQTPRRPSISRSRSRARGIVSPSQDSLPAQTRESVERRRKARLSAGGEAVGGSGEGNGKLMARVRRLSFAKKHRSTRSLVGVPDLPTSISYPLLATVSKEREERNGRATPPPRTSDLLPPIELQPPSPPRPLGMASSPSLRQSIEALRSGTPVDSTSPQSSRTETRSPTSPHTASLGRATQTPTRTREHDVPAQRRSSLGDLKIPARISQAQVGLRMNLGMVREFATSIERESKPDCNKVNELLTTFF
jgi:hypothetical protein